jgi:hypothetical protein
VGIVSKDASFNPQVAIPGFAANVRPGITLATAISGVNQYFQGTASNANTVGGISATGFVQTTTNQTMTGTLGILNDSGLSVGADSDFRASITGSDVFLRNQTQDGNLTLQINDGGVTTTLIQMYGANSMTAIPNSVTVNTDVNGVPFEVTLDRDGASIQPAPSGERPAPDPR